MTHQEQFEYKIAWKPGYVVRLHSDLVDRGKTFCSRICERHQWGVTTWTDVYEHTFHFELPHHAQEFKTTMGRFADQ